MKSRIKDYLYVIIQHKNFYYFLSITLSSIILYYSYNYYIKISYEKVQSVKVNIGKFKEKQLKNRIKEQQKQKKEKQKDYQRTVEQKVDKERALYKDKYDVVVDVMSKLNNSSFNIYKYNLNEDYDEIDLELNGSYLNLIKLFDYLQTIKANVEINSYTVELVNDKMVIKLKLKIGILKI